eukprot:jgi/Tetstr1/440333/TSEL_028669.t1
MKRGGARSGGVVRPSAERAGRRVMYSPYPLGATAAELSPGHNTARHAAASSSPLNRWQEQGGYGSAHQRDPARQRSQQVCQESFPEVHRLSCPHSSGLYTAYKWMPESELQERLQLADRAQEVAATLSATAGPERCTSLLCSWSCSGYSASDDGAPVFSSKAYERDALRRGVASPAARKQSGRDGAGPCAPYDFLAQAAHPRRSAAPEEMLAGRLAGDARELNSPSPRKLSWNWNGSTYGR